MTLSAQDRQILIQVQREKSQQAVDDARFNLDDNRLLTAANRIYYAIFYLVSAVAISNGFKTTKHLQLMSWFNRTFIKTGLLDKRYSKIYRKAFSKRQEGDYSDMVQLEKAELENLYTEMKSFLTEVEKLIVV